MGLLRQARVRFKVRFFVNVCEFDFRWSVFHEQPLQCTHVKFFRFFEVGQRLMIRASCGSNKVFFQFTEQQGWFWEFRRGTAWKRFLRPAHFWAKQLRVASTSASEPVGTMSSGRVPRGVSEYCSCLTRRSSAQLRGALSGSLDPVDTMSSGRVQSGVSKRRRCVRNQKDNFQQGNTSRVWSFASDVGLVRSEWLAVNWRAARHWGAQLRGAPASASVPADTQVRTSQKGWE